MVLIQWNIIFWLMLRLHIHGLAHGRDTDKCPYHVLVDRFISVSRPCHVRHGLKGQICPCRLFWDSQNNWHEQMSVSNLYRLRVVSALHPRCPRHIRITSVSYPCVIHTRIWQGCDRDTTRTPYGCNTDKFWPGRKIYHARGYDTNMVRVWHGFDTDNANATRMRHGRDTDVTRIQSFY